MTRRARRRRVLRLELASLLIASLHPFAAHGQSVLADDYASVSLQPGAMLSLWGSEPQEPGTYALALGLQARSLTLAEGADPPAAELQGSATRFELLASLGVWRSLDLSGAVALDRTTLSASNDETAAEQTQAGFGDIRLIPRARLWGGDKASGLALLLPVWIPSGANAVYADQGVRIEPRLAATQSWEPLILTANAGYRMHTSEAGWGTDSINFVTAGLGAEIQIVDAWSMLSEVSGRWSPHDRRFTTENGFASEAQLAARFSSSGWAAQFGAGTGLSGAASEPDWRMLASVSFSPIPEEQTLTPTTSPTDVSDEEGNHYPNQAPDWQPPAEPPDPSLAGDPPGIAPASPAERAPSPVERPSPPPPSTAPKRPAAPRTAESPASVAALRRELEEALAERQAAAPERVALPEITDVVRFAPNQMRLDAKQLAALDDVAIQLMAAPPDAHLLVEGHSDSSGPRGFNWKLSRMRATTVRYHLLQRGIDWRRISVRAYGASRPIKADLQNNPGENRRVEFRLIRLERLD